MRVSRGHGLVLIGYRGSGKTTLGRALSKILHRDLIDLDEEIEREHGSIRTMFVARGESAFREVESLALDRVIKLQPGCVLATGGGVVERETNRSRLAEHGYVVWLDANVEVLMQRLQRDPLSRPPLTDLALHEETQQVLARRRPWYLALADLRVDTAEQHPDQLTALIAGSYLDWLANRKVRGG